MIEDTELETYLYISPNKFGIYIYDIKKSICLLKEEYNFENLTQNIEIQYLSEFLEKNIFKIEKLIGKFIKNIFLVIESKKITNFHLGINKKNYDVVFNKKYIENLLTEAKDLFKENYHNQKIIHFLVNNYLINGLNHSSFVENLHGNNISLEVQFICIPNNLVLTLDKILEKFQIKIIKYMDGIYIKTFFNKSNLGFEEMVHKIKSGYNENEIILIPKNNKNIGFFEKFFQLFG